jgi:hypothetical protein
MHKRVSVAKHTKESLMSKTQTHFWPILAKQHLPCCPSYLFILGSNRGTATLAVQYKTKATAAQGDFVIYRLTETWYASSTVFFTCLSLSLFQGSLPEDFQAVLLDCSKHSHNLFVLPFCNQSQGKLRPIR